MSFKKVKGVIKVLHGAASSVASFETYMLRYDLLKTSGRMDGNLEIRKLETSEDRSTGR